MRQLKSYVKTWTREARQYREFKEARLALKKEIFNFVVQGHKTKSKKVRKALMGLFLDQFPSLSKALYPAPRAGNKGRRRRANKAKAHYNSSRRQGGRRSAADVGLSFYSARESSLGSE